MIVSLAFHAEWKTRASYQARDLEVVRERSFWPKTGPVLWKMTVCVGCGCCRDQAEVKRLERAKDKAEAVSKRHLDELALIRRLQRQRLGVGRKQKLTAQERETKRLLDAKVRYARTSQLGHLARGGVSYLSPVFGGTARGFP